MASRSSRAFGWALLALGVGQAVAAADRPEPRSGAGMVYDGARKVVVLFGGWDGHWRSGRQLGMGWQVLDWWDGRRWTEVALAGR